MKGTVSASEGFSTVLFKGEESFLIIVSLTEEIFIHTCLHSQKKTLFYCDCAINRQEIKNIRSVFFCVLSFDHLLDKTIVTDKKSVSTETLSQTLLA